MEESPCKIIFGRTVATAQAFFIFHIVTTNKISKWIEAINNLTPIHPIGPNNSCDPFATERPVVTTEVTTDKRTILIYTK